MAADVWSRFSNVVAGRPGEPALITDEAVISFAELRCAALHAAHDLAAAGAARGERCVVWGDNSPELAVTLLGLQALGAIPALVNADAPPAHFAHAAIIADARLAVVDGPRLGSAELDGAVLSIAQVGALGREASAPDCAAPAGGSEPASILFTSGSTGPPKGVCQSHENLLWGADAVAATVGLLQDDRILCAIPWAFDYGWGQLLSTVLRGAAQILPGSRNPFAICAAIEARRPTVLPAVPSLLASLTRGVSPIRDTDIGSIRLITNTGSRIPQSLFPEILEVFPQAAISLNYGLTETYRSASLPVELARSRPTSVGRAIPGVSLAVVREDGTEAAAGEEGEIVHRGSGVFLGYWGEPEKTALVRRPDPLWRGGGAAAPMAVFTGDLGWRDDEGLLYVRGRRDRQIKSMGVRVSPDEIEGLIHATDLVSEAAIVSRPHEMLGEMVVAVIVPRRIGENPTRALQASAKATMSPFMRPMEWNLVDALPRTPSGKVDYPALKQQFAGESRP